jgi:hypothetical protein
MRIVPLVALGVSLALPGVAAAHGNAVHARGTVKEIAPDHVVVAASGGDRSIALGPGTRILRGTRTVPVEDVHPGERVVVHAEREGDGLRATELRLAPAAGASGGQKKR